MLLLCLQKTSGAEMKNLKAGNFERPQIRELVKDQHFKDPTNNDV